MNTIESFLEILSENEKGTRYTLSHETIALGRAPDNDIVVDDKRVSRHHAHISYEEGEFFIEDLTTSNGTYVNKSKILNQKLHSGDIIQIGSYAFRFVSHFSSATQELSVASFQIPQKETIARIPEESFFSARLFLYMSGGLVLLIMVWVLSFPSKSKKPSQISRTVTPENYSSLSPSGQSGYSINWEKANQFYLSGYREFFSENYLRALDDFKTALELYPDHRLAQIYLKKTEDTITEKVNQHFKSALNYFNSAQYPLAIYHFNQVTRLIKHRKPPENYCAIREEKRSLAQRGLLENPDFEKYCESQDMINEAQARMSQ